MRKNLPYLLFPYSFFSMLELIFLLDTKLIRHYTFIFVVYNEINKMRSFIHFIITLLLFLKMHISIFTYVLGIKT